MVTREDYFILNAGDRMKSRRRHRYYWNDITHYCNYFSHEEYSVLEIGVGTGELLHSIKGKRKVGIDFSEKMIEQAKSKFPELELHEMPAEKIWFTRKFDLIIVSNLIGYVDDVQAVFEQLKKASHERTKIIVTYYNFLWEPLIKFAEWLGIKSKSPHQNWLSQNDIKNLLFLAGFDVYRRMNTLMFPFYIPLLSTLLNRYLVRLPLFRLLGLNIFSFATPQPVSYESVSKKYSVSIVIPARNEAGNIENAILRLPQFGKHQEILFIEGNSTDNTWETIQQVKEKYRSEEHTSEL